jgi:hypothetical protein
MDPDGRPKNMWIRWIRIRILIRNTARKYRNLVHTVVLFYFGESADASHKLILYCNVPASRPIGSDIEAGELVLCPGTLLGAAEVGVLAAVGATVVTVSSLPRVAVLSTGMIRQALQPTLLKG